MALGGGLGRGVVLALAVLVGIASAWFENPHVSGSAKVQFVPGEGWGWEVVETKNPGSNPDSMIEGERILGGTTVNRVAHPYVASLHAVQADGSLVFFCTAHLIAPDVAITAAHCLFPTLSYAVCAGSTNIADPGTCSQVVDISTHPEFDSFVVGSPDVSLLTLSEELYGYGIDTIRVAYHVPPQRKVYMVGFAIHETGAQFVMREAATTIVADTTKCPFLLSLESVFPGISGEDQMLCVEGNSRFSTGDIAACFDDSGGPLVTQNQHRVSSYGVFSFSNCNGGYGGESVYMEYGSQTIKSFLKPLVQTLRRNQNPKLPKCPFLDTGSNLTWFRSKATALREIGFAAIEEESELPEHIYRGNNAGDIDTSSAHLNRTTIFANEQKFNGNDRMVMFLNHGPPQKPDGSLINEVTISMQIRDIPKNSKVILLPGVSRSDTPHAGALDVTWKYGGYTHTGLQIVLPRHGISRCINYVFIETRESSLQFITPDPTYKGGRPYPVFEDFYFDICPWKCDKNVRNRNFNDDGPDREGLPVDFEVIVR